MSRSRPIGPYVVRHAGQGDAPGARSVLPDTFYREFDYGYGPTRAMVKAACAFAAGNLWRRLPGMCHL